MGDMLKVLAAALLLTSACAGPSLFSPAYGNRGTTISSAGQLPPVPPTGPRPLPKHTCTSGRESEKVAYVKCHVIGDGDGGRWAEGVTADTFAEVVKQADSIGATWIQEMDSEVKSQIGEPTCSSEETRASKVGRVLAAMGSREGEATCRPGVGDSMNCTYRAPVHREPEPQYHTTCSEPPVLGIDIMHRYELLTTETAESRGGVQKDPMRMSVDAARVVASEMRGLASAEKP